MNWKKILLVILIVIVVVVLVISAYCIIKKVRKNKNNEQLPTEKFKFPSLRNVFSREKFTKKNQEGDVDPIKSFVDSYIEAESSSRGE